MGCGSQRPVESVVKNEDKYKGRFQGKDKDKHREKSFPKVNKRKESKENLKIRKDSIAEIAITPSQFILELNESIYKNYSLKEKLGEGNISLNTRRLWYSLQRHTQSNQGSQSR